MRRPIVQFLLGAVVLIAGVLLLLEATTIVPSQPALWALLLAVGGAAFGYVFVADHASWWAAIPAAALLGAAVTRLMEIDPDGWGQWTEVPMLAAIGVGFLAVYLRDRRHWWALIPGGILVTLSVLTALSATVSPGVSGAIFLFGTSLTFALVALVPGGSGRRWWAYIPAGVLAAAGLVVLFTAADWVTAVNVVWPSMVIAAGGFLIWQAVRSRRQRAQTGEDQPATAANP